MLVLTYSFTALTICFFVLMLGYIFFCITKNNGILDLFWAPSILASILGCTAPNFVTHFIKKGFDLTSIGVLIFYSMIAIWAIRLTLFFLFRLLSSHDDRRYKKIIQSSSTRMFKQCLIQSFLQVLLVLTAYPLINESFTPSPSLMIISSIIFTIGFIGEWVSDDQLNRFKKIVLACVTPDYGNISTSQLFFLNAYYGWGYRYYFSNQIIFG